MKYVITGPTSPIGLALINECIKTGNKVIAIVNPDSERKNRLVNHESVKLIYASLNQLSELKVDDTADVFVHLAWSSTAGDAARNVMEAQADNIKYTLDAVNLAERLGCKTFIGSGSQAEYGRHNEVLTEESICNPESGYGMAKLCAGQMSRLYCKQKGIRHIWTRILSAYGPNCKPHIVINYTIIELLNSRVPSLSAGEQIWDFIHTDDVARALRLLAEKGKDGDTYLIGYGESKPLKEYLIKIRDIINPKLDLGLGQKPYGDNTVMHLACDISKLKKDTGFEPLVTFEEGIKETINWIKENYV